MLYIQRKQGFSLVELLVVIGVIALLIGVVLASSAQSRSLGRDAEVRTHVQTVKLALARAAQANSAGSYPGNANTWYCLKITGNCWKSPTHSANASLNSALMPYMPGATYPKPPGTSSGEYRFDAYLYAPSYTGVISGYTGPILVWWQEKPITNCEGLYAGELDTDVYYCYEKLLK
jgi:prepilin-type N-terminal cleavage/methylation domain-containing protein